MGRKKKNEVQPVKITEAELEEQRTEYANYVMDSPKYCEIVDPDNKYSMSELTKQFVYLYVEFKSLPAVCQSMDIDFKQAMSIFNMYSVQQEIKRLSLAKLQRRTATKLWDYAMLESYLTSFLTEEDVPANEQLSGRDKVNVARMIIDIKDKRRMMGIDADKITDSSTDDELKKLSVDTILMLLKQDDKNSEKRRLIERLKQNHDFEDADKQFIESLSVEELLSLIEGDEKQA